MFRPAVIPYKWQCFDISAILKRENVVIDALFFAKVFMFNVDIPADLIYSFTKYFKPSAEQHVLLKMIIILALVIH